MSTENKSFYGVMKSYNKNFWVASSMELFERWAWYGLFAVLALYLTGSTDEGGLGFTHTEKGLIMGIVTAILYLLPMITGVIADKIGYKLSLIIAYVLLMTGYYFMGEVSSFTSVFLVFLWVAVGAAMFKPVASAIITKNTDKSNSTLGFGIFYMMVNIGGFVGPAFSSTLRTQYGWKIVFLQAAIVIGINLLILIFFYKEEDRVKKEESISEAISSSLLNIWEAVKDSRLSVLLVIMVGFWTMFNQLFYTLPTFIEDWVNTSALHDSIANVSPWLASFMSGGGDSVNPEMLINIDAGAIIVFQLVVSYFVLKMRHVSAMITGFIIASIGIGITFYTGNGLYTILGIVIFAIGEMMTNPTFSSFIALISPKGKEALYMGTYFLPIFLGNFLTTFVSGNLYQAWSDKLSLLQTEMAKRAIEMPEISQDFTKNDYFASASEKLGMTQTEMTQMVWDTYNPNKIWYVIVAIGVVTILALTVYDRMVIRPKEAKAA
ncbi:MFS transporter [Lutibacter flavus]|uniref:Dipeptide/tripeptide permease n=1 Tax=Lutibacter flavus TaxID=691689 RepID=A0A238YZD2_9FLAO|nr:MFS transporter [Lutibacter flavus]SNR76437.1 Dipeptide/tripeptide permease [Lutibacter flavus]